MIKKKEVFIIHTKRAFMERRIVHDLSATLERCGYSIHGYSGWEFYEQPSTPEWSYEEGQSFDMDRYRQGLPWFQRSPVELSVDDDGLSWRFEKSRLIMIINPTLPRVSAGVEHELRLLNHPKLKRNIGEHLFLLCTIENSPLHPMLKEIDFDSTLNIRALPTRRSILELSKREPMPSDVFRAGIRIGFLMLDRSLSKPRTLSASVSMNPDVRRSLQLLTQLLNDIEKEKTSPSPLYNVDIEREAISLCDMLLSKCNLTSDLKTEATDVKKRLRACLRSHEDRG